jgi:multicomponent Na+:H+ antiporter subunit B
VKDSLIIKTVAATLLVPIVTFGIYIVLHGHLTPGGGFQGGAIIASAFILLLVAFSKNANKLFSKNVLSALESLALLCFIGLAFLGLQTSFFNNFLANSGFIFGQSIPFGPNPGIVNSAGTIPLMNIFVGLEVCCALTVIVFLMFTHSKGGENAR